MAGYTRQSAASIVALAEITAAPLNAEFNQLQSAFNGTTGHSHSGAAGDAPQINLTTGVTGILPAANGGTGVTDPSILTSTDATAALGPTFTLFRNSASPAAADLLGRILFQAKDSAAATEDMAEIYARLDDPVNGTEDGSLLFRTKVAGTMTTGVTLTGLTHSFPTSTVFNFNSDAIITHSAGILTVGTGDFRVTNAGSNTASVVTVGGSQTLTNKVMTSPTINSPSISDPAFSGTTATFVSGYAFNWNSGDVTQTHTANKITWAGASNGYSFDNTLLLPTSGSGFTFGGGDVLMVYTANTIDWTGASSGYSFDALLNLSSATAGQIKFPSTQNPSADANTLDDYKEGTFTPVLTSSGGGSGTYGTQHGSYTKIGRKVSINIHIILTANTFGAGTKTITGLPFTVNGNDHTLACESYSVSTKLAAIATASGTTVTLYSPDGSSGLTAWSGSVTSTHAFRISGTYFV